MRKTLLLVGIVAALVIPAAAIAATWDDRQNGDLVAQGAACPTGGVGEDAGGAWYHFVLNQVSPDYFDGPDPGTDPDPIVLNAVFDGGSESVGPTVVLKKVIHFDIFGIGELQSAATVPLNTGGTSNLVISGVDCGKKGDNWYDHR